MKPVLIVDGEQKEIYAMHYRKGRLENITVVEDGGVHKMYNDIAEDTQYYVEKPLQIDFSKCLFDESKLEVVEKINSEIEKLLIEKSKELVELSLQHTEACLKYPFSDDTTKRKYELVQSRQKGLMDAQEIITEFMYEDVDLSGGEDDASVQRMQPF